MIFLKNEAQNSTEKHIEVAKKRGAIYYINLSLLILGLIPTGWFGVLMGLILGGMSGELHVFLGFLIIVGEIMIIVGFAMSVNDYKRDWGTKTEQVVRRRKYLEIILSIIGCILIITMISIMSTIEWEFW